MKIVALLRLARLDRPVGILLLWWPVAWALWLAYATSPPFYMVWLFLLGSFCMRSAGCIVNDIVDRHIDLHVTRTKNRPLVQGELTVYDAFCGLFLFLGAALVILLQLPHVCFYYALLVLPLIMIYPFCKRYLPSPQCVLAIAFSVGIPMVYAAAHHDIDLNMWILLLINGLWVMAYDTIYACMDEADDRRIGIYSTALLFGRIKREIIIGIYILMHGLWLWIAYKMSWDAVFYLMWGCGAVNLCQQIRLLYRSQVDTYARAFHLNAWYGLWMFLGIAL